jgi:hypothetical protein
MENLVNTDMVPMRLAKDLQWYCVCGSPLLYSDNLKHVRCYNNACPEHLSERANIIFKDLGFKSLGPSFAKDLIRYTQCSNVLEIFNLEKIADYPYKDVKYNAFIKYMSSEPTIEYWKLFYYLFIPGLKTEWLKIVGTSITVDEVAAKDTPAKLTHAEWTVAKLYFKYIKDIEKYFNIQYNYSNKIIEVSITGSIRGVSNRNNFIPLMNSKYGKDYTLKQVGAKQSADFLVTDSDMRGHKKYEAALKGGVPILTSAQFEALLATKTLEKFMKLRKNLK